MSSELKNWMVHEIIVVEGKDDVAAVKKAVDCECVITHGHGFDETLLDRLEKLQHQRGLIILTDPDYAGKRIRERIRERIPQAKHAFLMRKSARKGDDIGVENAAPEDIYDALKKAHFTMSKRRKEFSKSELIEYGLDGISGAKERRIELCSLLNIGYANAKQLLAKLNDYDISRAEFESAMNKINGKNNE